MKTTTTRWANVHRGATRARAAATALLALVTASCEIKDADSCGAHQVYVTGATIVDFAVCVCDESHGYVFDKQKGYGCKQCPEGQSAVGGSCTSEVSDDTDAGASDDGGSTPPPAEPTGVGESCDSDADCAAFDAKYCAVQTHSCMVNNCATGENACQSAAVCCDYSQFLAGFSLCIADGDLEDGDCPMSGMKVEP